MSESSTSRILVVEDDEPIRVLVSTVLTRQGYHVDVAENGAVAVDRIQASPYDVIILDFMLPVMNGIQVIEWLKRERPGTAKDRVIVLTAAFPRDLRRFEPEDVFAVLGKPFDLHEMAATIERCLDRLRA
jgi:CheY-like chemotaxis protein